MPANLRYLAVDDDPAFHMVLAQMMQGLSYAAPVCATSATEALALLADPLAAFDAILLDIQMPGMNGIEACQRIRALPKHRDTPIMMITTLSGRHYVDQAFAVGATDYLTKPVERIELRARLSMLDKLVEERSLSRSLLYAMEAFDDLPGVNFDFDDAVALPKSDLLIDYMALQNHLLTLSRLKLHTHSAMAFQVFGAAHLYHRTSRIEFLDCMTEVGAAIAAALKRQSFLLSYAGCGEFVCVLNRAYALDPNEIEQDIWACLEANGSVFDSLSLPIPAICAGLPTHSGLFTPAASQTLLTRAISAVRAKGAPYNQAMAS